MTFRVVARRAARAGRFGDGVGLGWGGLVGGSWCWVVLFSDTLV